MLYPRLNSSNQSDYAITREEELEFFRIKEDSTLPEAVRKEAIDRLALSMMGYVEKLARSYCFKYGELIKWCSITAEDLVEEGMCGLIRAVQDFDSSRGASLETYAYRPINLAMDILVQKTLGPGAITRSEFRELRKMVAITTKFRKENDRNPTVEELAKLCGFTPDRARSLQELAHCLKSQSYEEEFSEDEEETFSPHLGPKGYAEPTFDIVEKEDSFNWLCSRFRELLSEKEYLCLALRRDLPFYGRRMGEHKIEEIASLLDLTANQVKYALGQARNKIETSIGEKEIAENIPSRRNQAF